MLTQLCLVQKLNEYILSVAEYGRNFCERFAEEKQFKHNMEFKGLSFVFMNPKNG